MSLKSIEARIKVLHRREQELNHGGWNATPNENAAQAEVYKAALLWAAFAEQHPTEAQQFLVVNRVTDALSDV